ncbi:MAG: hypothetical protein WCV91_00865 [Candidatus Margulisiibacteriota bacterium]|jgi:hypothetical protein
MAIEFRPSGHRDNGGTPKNINQARAEGSQEASKNIDEFLTGTSYHERKYDPMLTTATRPSWTEWLGLKKSSLEDDKPSLGTQQKEDPDGNPVSGEVKVPLADLVDPSQYPLV